MDIDAIDVVDLENAGEHFGAAARSAARRAGIASGAAAVLVLAVALCTLQRAPTVVSGTVAIFLAIAVGAATGSSMAYLRNRTTQRRAALLAEDMSTDLQARSAD